MHPLLYSTQQCVPFDSKAFFLFFVVVPFSIPIPERTIFFSSTHLIQTALSLCTFVATSKLIHVLKLANNKPAQIIFQMKGKKTDFAILTPTSIDCFRSFVWIFVIWLHTIKPNYFIIIHIALFSFVVLYVVWPPPSDSHQKRTFLFISSSSSAAVSNYIIFFFIIISTFSVWFAPSSASHLIFNIGKLICSKFCSSTKELFKCTILVAFLFFFIYFIY